MKVTYRVGHQGQDDVEGPEQGKDSDEARGCHAGGKGCGEWDALPKDLTENQESCE